MKPNLIALERNGMVGFIMLAVVFLIAQGCSETISVDPIPQPEEPGPVSGNIVTEQFWIGPEGGHIVMLDETVCLDFPEGSLDKMTLFNISSIPLDQLDLDGYNMMERAVVIEAAGLTRNFNHFVNIRMRYDVPSQKGTLLNEEDLTIYCMFGDFYRKPNIYSIGECCLDCECKTIQGSIDECGTFVVGEN
jgi:hypothetical protein